MFRPKTAPGRRAGKAAGRKSCAPRGERAGDPGKKQVDKLEPDEPTGPALATNRALYFEKRDFPRERSSFWVLPRNRRSSFYFYITSRPRFTRAHPAGLDGDAPLSPRPPEPVPSVPPLAKPTGPPPAFLRHWPLSLPVIGG